MKPAVLISFALALPLLAQTHHPGSHPTPKPAVISPTGPVAVFDTSAGRITCRLFDQQAPATAATFLALARGERDWTAADRSTQHSVPFYDGLQIFGAGDGIALGDRAQFSLGDAGPSTPPEKSGIDFDRPGLLAAVVKGGQQSPSSLLLTIDPDLEYSKRGTVFGQCDPASIAVLREISHALLATDNHPEHPVVLRKLTIVDPTAPLPPPAAPLPNEATLTVAPPTALPVPAPEPTGPDVTITTSLGAMHCKLFAKEAPIAVANFIGLATGTKPFNNPKTHIEVRGRRFYDGLTFRRVIPDFMIQNADMPFDPEGGGDLSFHFANEIVPGLSFDRPGRLAYANAGPNTNASEFFITEHPVRRLDGNYTIFGQCDDATVKLVTQIARLPRDAHNKPLTPVIIQHITTQPAN